MWRPKSEPPAAYSYECPTGGVRYYFRTCTCASGTDAADTQNDLSCRVAIVPEPSGQARGYEYIDSDEESD